MTVVYGAGHAFFANDSFWHDSLHEMIDVA